MDTPISRFQQLWQRAIQDSPLQQKSAVCISTIDPDGYPTGRFVDLKAVTQDGFIFCTSHDSAKGQHLKRNPKIALTVWWDHIGHQVRVIGQAEAIDDKLAQLHWKTRHKEAQLTTTAFQQSEALAAEVELHTRIEQVSALYRDIEVPKPSTWGGYLIRPHSIEFLTFKEDRLHLRELYTANTAITDIEGAWNCRLLQP